MSNVFHYLLGLGSNSGNRLNKLKQAVNKISTACMTTLLSPIYESQALLPNTAPASWSMPYLNAVLSAISALPPYHMLIALKMIENDMARDLEAPKWSPRTIDIDILLADIVSLPQPDLMPQIIQRALLNLYSNTRFEHRYTVINHLPQPIIHKEPCLSIPHPEMLKRDFVLIPAISIASYMVHPVTKQTLKAALMNNADMLTNNVILYIP